MRENAHRQLWTLTSCLQSEQLGWFGLKPAENFSVFVFVNVMYLSRTHRCSRAVQTRGPADHSLLHIGAGTTEDTLTGCR